MLDHMTFRVGDINQTKAFYTPVLATLGLCLVSHLDGGLDCACAVAGVENAGEALRCGRQQLLGEFDAGFMGEPEERRVVEFAKLIDDRLIDRRVVVSVNIDPQRGDTVEITITVGVPEVHSVGTINDDGFIGDPQGLLGERVPDGGCITTNQVRSGFRGQTHNQDGRIHPCTPVRPA